MKGLARASSVNTETSMKRAAPVANVATAARTVRGVGGTTTYQLTSP